MHLPPRNIRTEGGRDESPSYHRRQTPEEIQEMLTPKPVTGPCAADQYPQPITHGEIVAQVKAGSDEWGPREDWVIEPIAEPAPVQGPPDEIAQMEAERKFREANVKLAQAWLRRQDCLVEQAEGYAILDEKGFLKPLAEVQAALDKPGVDAFLKKYADSVSERVERDRLENLHAPGAKADNGKLDYTLVPVELEEAVCEILMFGAKKYSRDGWRAVPNAHVRYLAALERHIKAFKAGEDLDPESGLHHLKHAACNIAFLLHFLSNGQDIGAWRYEEERYNGA